MTRSHASAVALAMLFQLCIGLVVGCKEESAKQPQPAPDKPPAAATPPAASAANDAKPDFTLTAQEFGQAFRGGEEPRKAATAKYKGKRVELSGTVHNPGDGRLATNVHFILAAYEDPAAKSKVMAVPIFCHVIEGERGATLYGLSHGQEVTVRGVCEGMAASAIELRGCTIVKKGPDLAITVTAEDLAKAFAADEAAARAKYGDKPLIVSGKVAELKPDDYAIHLDAGKSAGGKPLLIQCSGGYDRYQAAKDRKKGDDVKVRGVCGSFRDNAVSLDDAIVMP